jgi:16S rRNA (uracil1498-N3)-methyltransferase
MLRKKVRRFFISPCRVKENQFIIEGREFSHLTQVLRHEEGDHVLASDGSGRSYEAQILRLDEKQAICTITSQRESLPMQRIQLSLLLSVPKEKAMSALLQKSVELGVTAIYPVCSERSILPFAKDIAKKKEARWTAILTDAAKQSGNPHLPHLAELKEFVSYEKKLSKMKFDRLILLSPYGESDLPQLDEEMRQLGKDEKMHLCMCIGPEGDWTPSEEQMMIDAGAEPLQCGEMIMRVDTAVSFVASVVKLWNLCDES